MGLVWERQHNPRWDSEKRTLFAELPVGLFPELRATADGGAVPGDWWRVRAGDSVVGFGWMDVTWGDAEVLLAVSPASQRGGVGTFVLDRLDEEAARRGLRYLHNVVPATHPEPDRLRSWLERRGFAASGEGNLLRRQVRSRA